MSENQTTTANIKDKQLYASFSIIGDIVTKKRPRAAVIGGFARVYTPKDTIYYESYVKSTYINSCKNIFFDDLPLYVEVVAYFKAPKEYEKFKEDVYELPCLKNKDLDNIAKTILDALNGIAYNDDKQIRTLLVQKYWTNEQERVDVVISQDGENIKKSVLGLKTRLAYNEYLKEKNKPDSNKKELKKLWNKFYKLVPDTVKEKILKEEKT